MGSQRDAFAFTFKHLKGQWWLDSNAWVIAVAVLQNCLMGGFPSSFLAPFPCFLYSSSTFRHQSQSVPWLTCTVPTWTLVPIATSSWFKASCPFHAGHCLSESLDHSMMWPWPHFLLSLPHLHAQITLPIAGSSPCTPWIFSPGASPTVSLLFGKEVSTFCSEESHSQGLESKHLRICLPQGLYGGNTTWKQSYTIHN